MQKLVISQTSRTLEVLVTYIKCGTGHWLDCFKIIIIFLIDSNTLLEEARDFHVHVVSQSTTAWEPWKTRELRVRASQQNQLCDHVAGLFTQSSQKDCNWSRVDWACWIEVPNFIIRFCGLKVWFMPTREPAWGWTGPSAHMLQLYRLLLLWGS